MRAVTLLALAVTAVVPARATGQAGSPLGDPSAEAALA